MKKLTVTVVGDLGEPVGEEGECEGSPGRAGRPLDFQAGLLFVDDLRTGVREVNVIGVLDVIFIEHIINCMYSMTYQLQLKLAITRRSCP